MADDNTPGSGMDNLSERAYEIAKRRQAAALEVVAMLEEQYDTWFGSSAATVLHASAWLAGTSLYRSFESGGDAAPGSAAFVERSNQEGLKLMKVFMFLVDKDGIQLKPEDFAVEIPAEQTATKNIGEVQVHFEKCFNDIMRAHEFDYREGAKTGAVACAKLMKVHCLNRTDLQPPVAASIVSMGFVEGAKTLPAALDGNNAADMS